MSPYSIDLEPLEVGPFTEVEGWPGHVASTALVRWRRTDGPNIVARFSPTPNRNVAVEALTLEASTARPLTSADLRSFQFKQLSSALVTFLGTWEDNSPWATLTVRQITRDDLSRALAERQDDSESAPWLRGLSGGFRAMLADPTKTAELREHGPNTIAAVEIVRYLLDYAAENGLAPHTLVRDALGLPKATASRWIAAARSPRGS